MVVVNCFLEILLFSPDLKLWNIQVHFNWKKHSIRIKQRNCFKKYETLTFDKKEFVDKKRRKKTYSIITGNTGLLDELTSNVPNQSRHRDTEDKGDCVKNIKNDETLYYSYHHKRETLNKDTGRSFSLRICLRGGRGLGDSLNKEKERKEVKNTPRIPCVSTVPPGFHQPLT